MDYNQKTYTIQEIAVGRIIHNYNQNKLKIDTSES